MNGIITKPQIIERTIPDGERRGQTYGDRTGWIEATTDDGLHALATTEAGAVSMIERMRERRRVKAQADEKDLTNG